MSDQPVRRRFLQLAGTGTVASIAGCAALQSSDDPSGEEGDAVAAVVQPDQEEAQQIQMELQLGQIEQEEAQSQIAELRSEAVSEFESFVDDTDELTIEEADEDNGIFLMSGPDDALLSILRDEGANGLVPGSVYEQVQEQQAAQEQQQNQGGTGNETNATPDTTSGEDGNGSGANDTNGTDDA